jgi:hypothetical protein
MCWPPARHGAPLENARADYLANLRVQAPIYHRTHRAPRRDGRSSTPHDTLKETMT